MNPDKNCTRRSFLGSCLLTSVAIPLLVGTSLMLGTTNASAQWSRAGGECGAGMGCAGGGGQCGAGMGCAGGGGQCGAGMGCAGGGGKCGAGMGCTGQ